MTRSECKLITPLSLDVFNSVQPPLSPAAPELWESVLLDFPTECLPATGVYPEHEDQPYVDITAVGRWVARRLPRLRQLRFECRHSRTFNNPSFDDNVAMGG